MSIVEYNLRIIIISGLLLVGAVWIVVESILKREKIAAIICSFLALACLASIFVFVSYNDEPVATGRIVEIASEGSWAGLLDTYKVTLEKNDGSEVSFDTSLFSSNKFKKSVEELIEGETITVYASEFSNTMYRFDK